MSIASVVLRGYGNGTVVGSVSGVVLRGYTVGVIPPQLQISGRFTIEFTAEDRGIDFPPENRDVEMPPEDRSIQF